MKLDTSRQIASHETWDIALRTSFRHFAQSLVDPFRARIVSEEDPVETHQIHHRSFS